MVCAALDSLPAQGHCAVVLQGGALMAQNWGFEIDRHESVWRLNMHALVPKHTGERTTMNVVNFASARSRSMLNSASALSFASTTLHAVTQWRKSCRATSSPWYYANESLVDGCAFAVRTRKRCSTGALAVWTAMQVCSSVDLYGGLDLPCMPLYFNATFDAKAAASRRCDVDEWRRQPARLMSVNDHDYVAEHRAYAAWDDQGSLRLRGLGSLALATMPESSLTPLAALEAGCNLFMLDDRLGVYNDGRRCGSCCGGTGDTTSQLCAGSDQEGGIANISLHETKMRCAADQHCVGFYFGGANGHKMRPVSAWSGVYFSRTSFSRSVRVGASQWHTYVRGCNRSTILQLAHASGPTHPHARGSHAGHES